MSADVPPGMGQAEGRPDMRTLRTRAAVAIATVTSLGLGGAIVLAGAAPAGAATAAATSDQLSDQSVFNEVLALVDQFAVLGEVVSVVDSTSPTLGQLICVVEDTLMGSTTSGCVSV
jgi:hypothetical protein